MEQGVVTRKLYHLVGDGRELGRFVDNRLGWDSFSSGLLIITYLRSDLQPRLTQREGGSS